MRKRAKKGNKALLLLLAVVLLVGCAVGGTLAWLTDKTPEVKNTFTTSDVDIELAETTGGANKEFKMVPGCTIEKDPEVTVKANSEKCWLFVKLEKGNSFDTFMTYTMADGWTELTGNAGVYCRSVDTSDADQTFDVIKDDKVTVSENVTKEQMNALTETTLPTLTVTAYACQWAKGEGNFSADDAWTQINSGT